MENTLAMDLISLIASIASLVLAIVAIFIAFHQKGEADKVNEKTQELLLDIKSDAKTISQVAMPELKAYGESIRNFVFKKVDNSELEKNEDGINNTIEELKTSLVKLKDENSLETIHEKLSALEDKVDSTKTLISAKSKIQKDELLIDLTAVDKGVIVAPYSQFQNFQQLLNMIYYGFLNEHVPTFSYGRNWVFLQPEGGVEIKKNQNISRGSFDVRNLAEVGIWPGNRIKLALL